MAKRESRELSMSDKRSFDERRPTTLELDELAPGRARQLALLALDLALEMPADREAWRELFVARRIVEESVLLWFGTRGKPM